MLPVSGAEQLSASGPMIERPASSMSGRVLEVGEAGPPGAVRHEEVPQAELARACACRSRITCGCSCGLAGRGDLGVVDRLGGVDVLVHEHLQARLQFARPGGMAQSPRQCLQSGLDEPADGVRQPLLVGVVVAALEVPAQVVAHDRGHLVAAQGVEPREVVDAPAVRGVRRHQLVGAGQAGHLAAHAGEVGAVGEDQEPAELDARVADAPDLPVDQRHRLGAAADQVAEPVVAVDAAWASTAVGTDSASRCRKPLRVRHQVRRDGRHRARPAVELVERRQRRRRRPAPCRAGTSCRAGSSLGGAQHPGRGQRRRHRGVVEDRLERTRPRPAPWRTRPARARRWRRWRAPAPRCGASASMTRAWRSMSCRPTAFCPGGTDFTTRAPALVSTR